MEIDPNIKRLADVLENHTKEDSSNFHDAATERRNIHEAVKDLNSLIIDLREDIKPIRNAYKGFLFGKNFIVGLSSFVLAIAAIGGGVILLIEFLAKR